MPTDISLSKIHVKLDYFNFEIVSFPFQMEMFLAPHLYCSNANDFNNRNTCCLLIK